MSAAHEIRFPEPGQPRFTVEINHGSHVTTATAEDVQGFANLVAVMILGLPTHSDRVKARRLLKRRLIHSEFQPGATKSYIAPPVSTGDCAANREPPSCVVCGKPKGHHDLDGLRNDCDGYVAP